MAQKALLLVVGLSLGLAVAHGGQAQALRVDSLSVRDGLSNPKVLAVLQDRAGFMWFGTLDGLNRYDGYAFTVYQNFPLDPTSLAGDVVYSVFEDRAGTLWVGTSGGLSRMDRTTGTFTHFLSDPAFSDQPWANDVGSLYEDQAGALWVGTFGGGLYRMDRTAGTPGSGLSPRRRRSGQAFTHYEHTPEDSTTLSSNVIEAIHEDRAGTLWVSTMNGLNRFDRAQGRFTRFLYPEDDHYNGSIVAFQEDAREAGVFWLSTVSGLVRFTPATGALERVIALPFSTSMEGGPWWSMPQGVATDPGKPEVLWVAMPREGLYRYDTATGVATVYRQGPGGVGGEPHSVYVDRTGLVWIGTSRGVDRFDPAASRFQHEVAAAEGEPPLLHRNVTALYEDRAGALWVGTGDFLVGTALSRIDGATGAATYWQPPPGTPSGLPDNISINALYQDRAGMMWIGTTPRGGQGALTRLDPATGTFTHWQHDPADPGSLPAGGVVVLCEDRTGAFWVGTAEAGLYRMDRAAGTPGSSPGQAPGSGLSPRRRRSGQAFTPYRHDPDDAGSLSGDAVRALLEDQTGQLWVGTNGGLSRLDRTTGTFVNYRHDPDDPGSLSSSNVFAIYEHPSEPGILWVSTGSALDRFDAQHGTVTHFTEEDGFPRYPVAGILGDEQGRLWMSTSGAGLLSFDPVTKTLLQYDEDSGVQARRFNPGAAFKSPRTGAMFFGGINGYNTFRPEQLQQRSVPPPVVVTDFKLFGQSVQPGERSLLPKPVSETREIVLSHDQNVFAFDFVALHYKNPARNRYAYRLEGFDDDWVMAGNRRTATYTNLSPGAYTFHVKAANSEGRWNDVGASVALTILPPWWRTWWAYALYGALLCVVIVAADRLRRWQVLRGERERSLLREKELRAQAAEAWANYLQAENQRQVQELESARRLQLSMLPEAVPVHPTVAVAAYMKTATEVGGDYYDFSVAEDGALTIAIGDATGHGAQAGTMVTAAKSLFTGFSNEPDLALVLRQSARAIRRMRLPKLFMAMALARVRGYTLELAGAGMPPALIYHAGAGRIEQVPLKGLPLGGPADIPYRKSQRTLDPGDTVLLMSDGFPELFNGAGEMLGYESVADVFADVADRPPEEIIAHLTATTQAWSDGRAPGDDMTFIVLKFKRDVADGA